MPTRAPEPPDLRDLPASPGPSDLAPPAAVTVAPTGPTPATPTETTRATPTRRLLPVAGTADSRPARRPIPKAEDIATLPPFDALDLDRILVVESAEQLAGVEMALLAEPVLGFDTESKPVFERGVTHDGPHLAQFAASGRAWLIPLHIDGSLETLGRIIASTTVRKVGFGLDSDLTLLRRRLGREPQAVHDIDADFRGFGYRGALGLKSAVAVLLGRRFTKSKRIGTSNWARRVLTPDQIRYAANDAWGAFCIHEALQRGHVPRDLSPTAEAIAGQ